MSTEARGPHETLQLVNLCVSFSTAGTQVQAVRGLNLTVAPGECLGVVGESGAGKTQAFLGALGLLAPNGRAGGQALFGECDLLGLSRARLDRIRGARIGMVFQDPMTSLTPHLCVGDQVAEPLVRHAGLSFRQARIAALGLLRQVQLTDVGRRARQFPHELSGGMRQRVMIAIALACEPTLLIADEPTTALDVTIQAQILVLLGQLMRARGMSMVLITHDFGAVAGVADRVAVMQAGRLVELDSATAVLKSPRHPYTQALLKAMPRLDDPPGPVFRPAPVALSLQGLHVQFRSRGSWRRSAAVLRAVDDVTLEVHQAEALGLLGESGSGKSTLARAVLQLLRADSGRVVWMGRSLSQLSQQDLRPLRRDLQIIFQDPLASLDPRMTAGAIVAEGLRVHEPGLDDAARRAAVSSALQRVGLDAPLARRYPHELSGGQCQRIGIARAIILRPRLLVCDEPVSALDMSVQGQIIDLLAGLKREYGLSMLFISHNLAVVRRLCERIAVLYLGRMMELAGAHDLYAQPLHPYARQLLDSAPVPDPDVQPGRLLQLLTQETGLPASPPGGCIYRMRCAHAIEICRQQVPGWEQVTGLASTHAAAAAPVRWVACHRWRELALSSTHEDGNDRAPE